MINVLILDDEPAITETVKACLEDKGLAVRTSLTSEDARRAIEQQPPQLVLLDIKLKEADGLEVLKWMKRHHPAIQVIVLTGVDIETIQPELKQLGALAVIHKPVSIPELQRQILVMADKFTTAT